MLLSTQNTACFPFDVRKNMVAFFLTTVLVGCIHDLSAQDGTTATSLSKAIAAVSAIGPEGEGNQEAIEAANILRTLSSDQLPIIFEAMKVESPVAKNWFRGIASDIVRKTGGLSDEQFEMYVKDHRHNADGRALAMEFYRTRNPSAAEVLVDASLDDPSLLIREMAVDRAIKACEEMVEAKETESAIKRLTEVLSAARHPRQLESIVGKLRDLGSKVTLAESLSMIQTWQALAPFDNREEKGFEVAYAPETAFIKEGAIDLKAEYDGKNGSIVWKEIQSKDDAGVVDLAAPLEKEKGAVAYLYVEKTLDQPTDAQVRLTTKNANIVWVNGEQVMSNEVYHSGSVLDQYIGQCKLRAGVNRILIKLCQNEQTEPWAQEYQFQCRLTDPAGKPIR
jgi:hypothetical protein